MGLLWRRRRRRILSFRSTIVKWGTRRTDHFIMHLIRVDSRGKWETRRTDGFIMHLRVIFYKSLQGVIPQVSELAENFTKCSFG